MKFNFANVHTLVGTSSFFLLLHNNPLCCFHFICMTCKEVVNEKVADSYRKSAFGWSCREWKWRRRSRMIIRLDPGFSRVNNNVTTTIAIIMIVLVNKLTYFLYAPEEKIRKWDSSSAKLLARKWSGVDHNDTVSWSLSMHVPCFHCRRKERRVVNHSKIEHDFIPSLPIHTHNAHRLFQKPLEPTQASWWW